jgi:hypothetical protein
VFVDGKAIRDGSQTLKLVPGDHSIGIYNYGYKPNIQTVSVEPGKTVGLDVTLAKSGGEVTGPFADI